MVVSLLDFKNGIMNGFPASNLTIVYGFCPHSSWYTLKKWTSSMYFHYNWNKSHVPYFAFKAFYALASACLWLSFYRNTSVTDNNRFTHVIFLTSKHIGNIISQVLCCPICWDHSFPGLQLFIMSLLPPGHFVRQIFPDHIILCCHCFTSHYTLTHNLIWDPSWHLPGSDNNLCVYRLILLPSTKQETHEDKKFVVHYYPQCPDWWPHDRYSVKLFLNE